MVKGLPIIQKITCTCEGCQLGKMFRKPFPTGQAWGASQKSELVHTNVCGSMRTPSLIVANILYYSSMITLEWLGYTFSKKDQRYLKSSTNLKAMSQRRVAIKSSV